MRVAIDEHDLRTVGRTRRQHPVVAHRLKHGGGTAPPVSQQLERGQYSQILASDQTDFSEKATCFGAPTSNRPLRGPPPD